MKSDRIFNISLRHQLALERLKLGQITELEKVLSDLRPVLIDAFSRSPKDNLGDFTKTELEQFIRLISRSVSRVTGNAEMSVSTFMAKFIRNIIDLSSKVWIKVEKEYAKDESEVSNAEISQFKSRIPTYEKIANEIEKEIIPVYGSAWPSLIQTLGAAVLLKIVSRIRTGYALNEDKNVVLNEILGNARKRNGIVGSAIRAFSTALDAAIQHADMIAQRHVQSKARLPTEEMPEDGRAHSVGPLPPQSTSGPIPPSPVGKKRLYVWISVLDDRTSVICRTLAYTVWEYGKGPLPPAHPNCRSRIMPYVAGQQAGTINPRDIRTNIRYTLDEYSDSYDSITRG